MKRSVLVTGGAGFIGSHLCRRLLAEGFRVVCMDNLYTGSRRNIEELERDPDFTFIRHDVREAYDADVEQIYNLACPASPVHYQNGPVATAQTSVLGAINALELARRRGARVLQASTSEVYGDPLVHPQTEDYWGNVNPIGIRSCYDEGKRMAETLFCDYRRQYGVDTRIVRIFNTYGPRMQPDDGRVVSNFILQALKGEDITIYGDGQQTRSFCFVSDTVDAIYRLMNADGVTGPVNVGNPQERTMWEIAGEILALTGSASKLVYRPLPQDDPTRRRPDISRAMAQLNWAPKVALRDGLKETIEYFRTLSE